MPAKKVARKTNKKSSKSKIRVGGISSLSNKFNKWTMLVFAVLFAGVLSYFIYRSFAASTTVVVNAPVIGIAGASTTNDGYWLVGTDGGVFSEGTASKKFYGSANQYNPSTVVGIEATADLKGYWVVSASGGVYNFGDAGFYGASPTGLANCAYNSAVCGTAFNLGEKIVALVPDYAGYWLVSNFGRVWSFGDAPGGNTTNGTLVVPGGSGAQPKLNGALAPFIVGAARGSDADFWLVGSSGQIFPYGTLTNLGQTPAGNNGIVGMASNPAGTGYWLVDKTGNVYAYGVNYYGGMGGTALNGPITGIASTSDAGGYWLSGEDGGVFAFGDALFQGRVVAPTPAPAPTTSTPTPTTTTTTTVGTSSTAGSGGAASSAAANAAACAADLQQCEAISTAVNAAAAAAANAAAQLANCVSNPVACKNFAEAVAAEESVTAHDPIAQTSTANSGCDTACAAYVTGELKIEQAAAAENNILVNDLSILSKVASSSNGTSSVTSPSYNTCNISNDGCQTAPTNCQIQLDDHCYEVKIN